MCALSGNMRDTTYKNLPYHLKSYKVWEDEGSAMRGLTKEKERGGGVI